MTFPSGLRALNHRNFRRFFIGQAVSLVGTWMQSVAQSWLVLQLTDSAFKLGLIGTLQFAPVLAFAVLAGALADRLPKRRLILGTQTLLATQALALAALVWSGHVRFWHVGLLALVLGFANALDMPARQSFVADLVVKADMVSAVALNSAAFNAARIVGPAVAGLLIARVGVAPAFLLNGLSFLVVIGALLATNVEGRSRRAAPTTIFEEIREGLAYARHTPRIRFILSVLLVVSLCVFNFSVLVPLLARNVLHQGAAGFGFLMAAIGVGAVAGALTLGMLGRRPRLRVIVGAGALACAAFLGVAFVRDFGVALAVLFVVGFAAIITAAGCNTTLQVSAPDALRGRVMSLYILIFSGSFPVGAFLMGAISERWGVSTAFFVGGATGLLGLAVITISSRSRR
ncbi:MAG TPA: MFS transporter [Methylomirabilota bacterium]|jgi:predicted MFS family arabinose efflux permease|nr:MFS transporter [Methylomirabilota bacterium]